MDPERRIFRDGAIALDEGRILEVGKSSDIRRKFNPSEKIDARSKIVMPGLIDAHLHQNQMLARGLADEVDLLTWIHKRVWPYEAVMTDSDSYVSSLLCSMEAIKTGTTCFADPGGYRMENVARAVDEIGIRGIIAWASMDVDDPQRPIPEVLRTTTDEAVQKNEELLRNCQNSAKGRLRVWCGLRVEPNVSPELIVRINELALKNKVGVEMHNAVTREQMEWVKNKTGKNTVDYLDSLGVLGPHWLLIHMGWITDQEVQVLKRREVNVAHVPGASMKAAYGAISFGKFPELVASGVNVCLGCDSSAANNSLDMFRAMYLAAMVHKEARYDPHLIPAEEALEMATIRGAKALRWEDIGSLEPGKKADLIIINPKRSNWIPNHDFSLVPNIAYSADGNDVETVMVDGRIVMENRRMTTIDEEKTLESAQKAAEQILDRLKSQFGLELKPQWKFV